MQEEHPENPENNQEERLVSAPEGVMKQQKSMINTFITVSFALNILLLAGLIVLYILFFSSKKSVPPDIPQAFHLAGTKTISVVFVNIDSLNSRYEFVKLLRDELETTGRKLQAELMTEQSQFEKEATDFQKKVAANTIPEDKAKAEYESLMQRQQNLVEKKDRYTQQVADQELKLNMRLLDTVTNFLKRYNRQYHYDYILGFKTAGEILVANDTLDITSEVLNALNKEHNDRKK